MSRRIGRCGRIVIVVALLLVEVSQLMVLVVVNGWLWIIVSLAVVRANLDRLLIG